MRINCLNLFPNYQIHEFGYFSIKFKIFGNSVGSDLSVIEKGLNKIKLAIKEKKEITADIIESQIGFSKELIILVTK